jgi:predicted N-acetyltransferase YhbS
MSHISIRLMTENDIPFGLTLCRQAGWNQTRADWSRFLALQSDGCFVAIHNDQPVGTVTTCVFESVGWIGMMLVEVSRRGGGIGRALMEHAIEFLKQCGVHCVRLDATALGRPLYGKLGFHEQARWVRYGGIPSGDAESSSVARPLIDSERLFQLDRSVVTYDRRRLLECLLLDRTVNAFEFRAPNETVAFLFERPGAIARYLGPCIAESSEAGAALVRRRLNSEKTPTFVDVPIANRAAVEVLESAGLMPQREFTRMALGPCSVEHLEQMWASSGPEKG